MLTHICARYGHIGFICHPSVCLTRTSILFASTLHNRTTTAEKMSHNFQTFRWIAVRTLILCAILCYLNGAVRCTKYYVTRHELKKRLDEQKKPIKDPIQSSNSNTYLVDDGGYGGYDSQEVGDYGDYHQDGYNRIMSFDKKSKFFGDEISFVIVVVTLTVFFGILSSLLIPLTLLIANGGIGGGFGLSNLGFGGLNTILPVAGIGTPSLMGKRRRRRSLEQRNEQNANEYASLFDIALSKFEK